MKGKKEEEKEEEEEEEDEEEEEEEQEEGRLECSERHIGSDVIFMPFRMNYGSKHKPITSFLLFFFGLC